MTNREIFDASAKKLIARYSGGLPRVINGICDMALLEGYVQQRTAIDEAVIKKVAEVKTEEKFGLVSSPPDLSLPEATSTQRLLEGAPQSPPCSYCGGANAAGARYCSNCGIRL